MQVARPVDILAGDVEERLRGLFDDHYQGIVGLLYRLLGSREEAEEQAQEAFIRLTRNAVIWRPREEVLAWLRRVALNLGYNVIRSRRRELDRLQRNARLEQPLQRASSADPETRALRAEEIARVRASLVQLPAKYQACLLLRYSGLSYKEVAVALGVAPGSVGTLLARAEEAFRTHYKE